MKRVRTMGNGDIVVDETECESPGAGNVAVEVEAATVNPIDVMVIDGQLHDLGFIDHEEPLGLGWDAVGRVVASGQGVEIEIGARVALVRTGPDTPAGACP